MDTNTVLLWLACFSCGATFFSLLGGLRRPGVRPTGWIFVSPAILMIAGLLWWFWRNEAGYVAGALWALFVVVPVTVQRRVRRLAGRLQFGPARKYALAVRWLHPWDGWFSQPALLRALELADRGETDEAAAILERLRDSPWLGLNATVHLYRIRQQWGELVGWVRHFIGEDAAAADPAVLPMYLRALGEIGDLPGLLGAFDRARGRAEAFPPAWPYCRLYLFTFCGQTALVERLLDGPLFGQPAPVRHFWLATAEMAAGLQGAGEARLGLALSEARPAMRQAMEYRLAHPPAEAGPILESLGPRSREVLDAAEQEHEQETRYGEAPLAGGQAIATWTLIGLNFAAFGVELFYHASNDDDGLFRLGALSGPAVQAGQWWRLLAANFLHFGWLHLSMNMLGLYVLGPFVEQALGRVKFAFAYLVAGLASMVAVLTLQSIGWVAPGLLVGASGAIMGLVGATAAILLRGWMRERARAASRRLQWVLTIVVLQIAFDAFTPEVSSTAHLAGMLCGFVLTLLLYQPPAFAARGFAPLMPDPAIPPRQTPADELLPPSGNGQVDPTPRVLP